MEKSGLGHNMQSYRSPEMAKMALDVEVEAEAYQWRDGSHHDTSCQCHCRDQKQGRSSHPGWLTHPKPGGPVCDREN